MEAESKPIVLMVEDDPGVMLLNRSVMEREGYAVLAAPSLAAARGILAGRPRVDIAVLDILLPDGNGLGFIPELRAATAAPVLVLTSRNQYRDIVDGLTGDADDYMTKPYRIEELLARMAALVAKGRVQPPAEIRRGALMLDTVAQRAFLGGEDMLLKPREYAALLYLVQKENQTVPAERLYEAVWKLPLNADAGAVKTTLSRLRRKLAGSGYTIASARGEGYRFKAMK